jgi:hypothetical protein
MYLWLSRFWRSHDHITDCDNLVISSPIEWQTINAFEFEWLAHRHNR